MLTHESGVGNGRVPLRTADGDDMGERARTREKRRMITFKY